LTLGQGRPQPGDEAIAEQLAARYEIVNIAGNWDTAWAMLAPEHKASSPGFADFEQERSQFITAARGHYVARPPIHDADQIQAWVATTRPVYPVTPDYDRAFLVRVDFPVLEQDNAGWEQLLVAPVGDGSWFIWVLR
jgi:hypothetical protein